jgi:hypothetical protein
MEAFKPTHYLVFHRVATLMGIRADGKKGYVRQKTETSRVPVELITKAPKSKQATVRVRRECGLVDTISFCRLVPIQEQAA